MTSVSDICSFFDSFAPPTLAEDWDNVGLLLGRTAAPVERISTCLTLTADVAEESIAEGVHLIVTHHPVMFRPVQRITESTAEGSMLLKLLESGIAVYSPHTRFDSAADGINQRLAKAFGLQQIAPLRPQEAGSSLGGGRWGRLSSAIPLSQFLAVVRKVTAAEYLEYVGEQSGSVQTVAVACGAAGEFMAEAAELGCDTFVTGEARFHSALEARSKGIQLVLPGHFCSERPAVQELAKLLADAFPDVTVVASRVEEDPLKLFV